MVSSPFSFQLLSSCEKNNGKKVNTHSCITRYSYRDNPTVGINSAEVVASLGIEAIVTGLEQMDQSVETLEILPNARINDQESK